MVDTEPCITCKWWFQLEDYPEEGMCHRHSPVLLDSEVGSHIARWPMTRDNQSCGDWGPSSDCGKRLMAKAELDG